MSMTTSKDRFPVIDVTHKSKRSQAGNLEIAMKNSPSEPNSEENVFPASVPKSITLERAIEFYESHSEGEYKTLYTLTAKWLRDYMSKRNTTITTPGSHNMSDSDIEKAQEVFARIRGVTSKDGGAESV